MHRKELYTQFQDYVFFFPFHTQKYIFFECMSLICEHFSGEIATTWTKRTIKNLEVKNVMKKRHHP